MKRKPKPLDIPSLWFSWLYPKGYPGYWIGGKRGDMIERL